MYNESITLRNLIKNDQYEHLETFLLAHKGKLYELTNEVDEDGNTVLHEAVTKPKKNKRAINLLLKNCADPYQPNNKGKTPLDLVTKAKSKSLIKLLGQDSYKYEESLNKPYVDMMEIIKKFPAKNKSHIEFFNFVSCKKTEIREDLDTGKRFCLSDIPFNELSENSIKKGVKAFEEKGGIFIPERRAKILSMGV